MRSTLDWDKFKIFYHVAQAGSFTRAAEILKITQPSLSRTIQSLEEQIQTKLFNRTAKGVVPTSEGRLLYKSLEKVYREFIQSEIYLQNQKKESDCVLRVGILRSLATPELIDDLTGFMFENPHIRLHIVHLENEKEILDYKTDVAILPSLFERGENIDWTEEYLFSMPQGLYASPQYVKDHGHPKTLEELKRHRFILFAESPDLYPAFLVPRDHTLEDVQEKPRASKKLKNPHYCINSCEGMRQGAEKGHGITILYGSPDRILENSSLVAIQPTASIGLKDIPLYFVYPSYSASSERIEAFGNYVKSLFNTSKNSNTATVRSAEQSSNIRPFKSKN